MVIGCDGCLFGFELMVGLVEGLCCVGCVVIDIGLVLILFVYYVVFYLCIGICVVVIGSYNLFEYNGFKVVIGGEMLFGDVIIDFY